MRCRRLGLLLVCSLLSACSCTELNLGMLFPLGSDFSGKQRAAAGLIAIEHINANISEYVTVPADLDLTDGVLPAGVSLNYTMGDTQRSTVVGTAAFVEIIPSEPIGVVGAASSSVSAAIQVAASVFDIPQVSYSSTSDELSDSEVYPMFARVVPADSSQAAAMADFVLRFNWTNIASISSSDNYGIGIATEFAAALHHQAGLELVVSTSFAGGSVEGIQSALDTLSVSGARVIMLSSDMDSAAIVLDEALARGMLSDDYVWILCDAIAQDALSGIVDADLTGLIGFTPAGANDNPAYTLWIDEVWSVKDTNSYPAVEGGDFEFATPPNEYVPFAYDAVWLFALAIRQLHDAGWTLDASDVALRQALFERLHDVPYAGLTGEVLLNTEGDRSATYDILNFAREEFHVVGSWTLDEGLEISADIYWRDNTTTPPSSVLICQPGFELITVGVVSYCSECKHGTYDIDGDNVCEPCPEGAVCLGGMSVLAAQDYWQYEQDFYLCLPGACCPDGVCGQDNPCADHRHGILCGVCDEGYSEVGGVCVECPGANYGSIVAAFATTLVLVLAFIGKPQHSSKVSGGTKILIDFLQVVALCVPPDSTLEYKALLGDVLGFEDTVNSCSLPFTPLQAAMSSGILPGMLLCWLVLVFAFDHFLHFVRPSRGRVRLGGYIRAAWRVILLTYTAVCFTAMTLLHCRTVGPYVVLWAQPGVKCWETSGHVLAAVIFGLLFFLFGVLLPIGTVFFLRHMASKLKKPPQTAKPHPWTWMLKSISSARDDEKEAESEDDEDENELQLAKFDARESRSRSVSSLTSHAKHNKHDSRSQSVDTKLEPITDDRPQLPLQHHTYSIDSVASTASSIGKYLDNFDEDDHEIDYNSAEVTRYNSHISHNHKAVYGVYRPEVRTWYESFFVTRRTIFVLISVYGEANLLVRQLILLLFSACLLCTHLILRPFHNWYDNALSGVAMLAIQLVVSVSLIAIDGSGNYTRVHTVNVLIVLLLCLTLVPMLWVTSLRYMKRLRTFHKANRHKLPSLRGNKTKCVLQDVQLKELPPSRSPDDPVEVENVMYNISLDDGKPEASNETAGNGAKSFRRQRRAPNMTQQVDPV